MPIIAVSGHSRKVGKTSIVEGLIAALPEYNWTALKVSPHRHRGDSGTKECGSDCCAVVKEISRGGENDTSRFLRAGARSAFWIQAERIEAAVSAARAIIENSSYVVIEGNSLLDFISADFSIMVLNDSVTEFKETARGIMLRSDALVLIQKTAPPSVWKNFPESISKNTPQFKTPDPKIFPQALKEFIQLRLQNPDLLNRK